MKKLLTLALLSALLLSTAACVADATDTTTDTTAGDAVDTTTAVTTEPPEYIAPEGVDYGGATFTVAANNNWDSGWVLASYCEIVAEEENGEPINDAIYQRNRIVEEELNVKLDVFNIPKMSSTSEIMTAVMSGDDMFQAASPNGSSMSTFLAGQDICVNLLDIDTLDLDASWWNAQATEEFRIFDKQYAITGDFNFYSNGAPICNFFSKKLVEDLKLDDPYQIVRDGDWTLDVFFEFAEAAARDVNGDGVMTAEDDTWGILAEGNTMPQVIRSCNQRLSKRDADGNIEIVVNTEKTSDILEKFVPFIRNKNVNMYATDYVSNYTSVFNDLFLPRFIDNGAMFYCNQILVALNLRNMEADFGILPMPKYDEAQSDYVATLNTAWATFVFVPLTCGDLDMTGNVLNSLGYYSQQYITPAFIDQTVMSKTIRDEDTAEMIVMLFDNQSYDIATYFNWGNVNSNFATMLGNSNSNFASEYAKIEPNIISAMQTTMDHLKGN